MNDTSHLISDEKPTIQLKRLIAELHELEAETFEVEDTSDLGQDAAAMKLQSSSCCSCTSCVLCSCIV